MICTYRFRWYFRSAGLPANRRFTSLSCIWARSDKARRSGAGRALAGCHAAVGDVAGRERRDVGRLRVRRGSDREETAGGWISVIKGIDCTYTSMYNSRVFRMGIRSRQRQTFESMEFNSQKRSGYSATTTRSLSRTMKAIRMSGGLSL